MLPPGLAGSRVRRRPAGAGEREGGRPAKQPTGRPAERAAGRAGGREVRRQVGRAGARRGERARQRCGRKQAAGRADVRKAAERLNRHAALARPPRSRCCRAAAERAVGGEGASAVRRAGRRVRARRDGGGVSALLDAAVRGRGGRTGRRHARRKPSGWQARTGGRPVGKPGRGEQANLTATRKGVSTRSRAERGTRPMGGCEERGARGATARAARLRPRRKRQTATRQRRLTRRLLRRPRFQRAWLQNAPFSVRPPRNRDEPAPAM